MITIISWRNNMSISHCKVSHAPCPYHISDTLDSPQFRFTDSPKEIKKNLHCRGKPKYPTHRRDQGPGARATTHDAA